MNNMKKLLLIIALFLIIPNISFGQMNLPYEPLAPLPGTTGPCSDGSGECIDFERYLPTVFTLLIGFAGVIAVVQIVIGGVLYLSTDAIQGKSAGKAKILNALTGLLLIIASYIILNTINPRALNLNLTIASYTPPTVGSERPATSTPGNPNAGTLAQRCGANNLCAQPNACSANQICDLDATCSTKICNAPTTCPGGTCNCPNCVTIGSSATDDTFRRLPLTAATNQLDRGFATRLLGLAGLNEGTPPVLPWTITEAYPPTRIHVANCHREGTCVDADVTNPTTANVLGFYNQARGLGLRVVYETSDQAEFNRLRAAGIPAYQPGTGGSGVQLLTRGSGAGQISGNHFSVYNQ